VRRKWPTVLVARINSSPCFVLAPAGAPPIPALFHRTSSLLSWTADASTASLMVARSARLRGLNLMSPDVRFVDCLMLLIAALAFSWERH